MPVTLRWTILRNIALPAMLALTGQTDSSVIDTATHQDHQPVTGATVPNEADSGTPVPITRLNPRPCPTCPFAYYSGIKGRVRLVIRGRDAWRDVWEAINAARLPLPRLPEIDFTHEMVVVVGLGERREGGYGNVVDRAYEADDELEIMVTSRSPGRNCARSQALTQPVDVVKLPRIERSVIFQEDEIVHECKH